MKRNRPVLGQVRDVLDGHWDVLEIRPTKYGFDLLFGSPAPRVGNSGGPPRLIVTQPLFDFWQANRTNYGVLYDLPAGRSTLKRLRHRFGFRYLHDLSRFWSDRIEDLKTLSTREFAARHNVGAGTVRDTRTRLLGRRVRKLGWWRKSMPLKILRSNLSLSRMGRKLHISVRHARRLKLRARLCDASCQNTPPDASQILDPSPQTTEQQGLTPHD